MTDKNDGNDNNKASGFVAISVAIWDGIETEFPTCEPDVAYAINVRVSGDVQQINNDLFEMIETYFANAGQSRSVRSGRNETIQ